MPPVESIRDRRVSPQCSWQNRYIGRSASRKCESLIQRSVGAVLAKRDLPMLAKGGGTFQPICAGSVEILPLKETAQAVVIIGLPNARALGRRCTFLVFEFHWKRWRLTWPKLVDEPATRSLGAGRVLWIACCRLCIGATTSFPDGSRVRILQRGFLHNLAPGMSRAQIDEQSAFVFGSPLRSASVHTCRFMSSKSRLLQNTDRSQV